jgi:hypothetical protein
MLTVSCDAIELKLKKLHSASVVKDDDVADIISYSAMLLLCSPRHAVSLINSRNEGRQVGK